jgi:hypothetical protein
LYSLKTAIKRSGQRVRQRRLANAGHVFDKQMTAGNQGHNCEPDRLRLAFNDRFDCLLQPFDSFDCVRCDYPGLSVYCLKTSHQMASLPLNEWPSFYMLRVTAAPQK